MIVVDTSVLIAILFKENDTAAFVKILANDHDCVTAAPNMLEAIMVAQRVFGIEARAEIETLLAGTSIRVVAWGPECLAAAHDAFVRYGKGSGHAAQLNFGDCMSYALARSLDAPLLFKGDDFAQTDIRSAL